MEFLKYCVRQLKSGASMLIKTKTKLQLKQKFIFIYCIQENLWVFEITYKDV